MSANIDLMYDTVIVPVDGSEESYAAAEEAVEITAESGTVHGLAVVEELPMHKRSAKGGKLDSEPDADAREQAKNATEQVAALADDAGLDVVTAVTEGVPAREIVDYAEETDTDAIVVGKRGLDKATQDMLGSTSERILKEAPTTIVAVPGEQ